MIYEIGKIPYIDAKAPSNEARKHRPVYLRSAGNTYVVQVEGYSSGELPPPRKDLQTAILAAKKFIRRNKGASYKKVALASIGSGIGRKILDSAPTFVPRDKGRGQNSRDNRR